MTAAAFRATYSDWRLIKGRKVVQVVFELPLEQADQAYDALGGMPNPAAEVWCGIARLVQPAAKEVIAEDTTHPSVQPASATLPGRAPNKLAQLAGMLGKDPLFHRWLEQDGRVVECNEEKAAAYIREYCGVRSRSEITMGRDSGECLLTLYDNFGAWRDADQYVEAS